MQVCLGRMMYELAFHSGDMRFVTDLFKGKGLRFSELHHFIFILQ